MRDTTFYFQLGTDRDASYSTPILFPHGLSDFGSAFRRQTGGDGHRVNLYEIQWHASAEP